MEKLIARLSYWLGIACLLIALIWKAVSVVQTWHLSAPTAGASMGYLSFLHGSILFLVATIATVGYVWLNSQKH